jgi:hypothetical protein
MSAPAPEGNAIQRLSANLGEVRRFATVDKSELQAIGTGPAVKVDITVTSTLIRVPDQVTQRLINREGNHPALIIVEAKDCGKL